MNESTLNGLLNLFAIFASIVRLPDEQARQTVHSYLSSHFGVRSHKEYIALYNELRTMYDDSLFEIDKEAIVRNICGKMKVKLTAEEQLLLFVRFVEFAYTNNDELFNHLSLFHSVANLFALSDSEFEDAVAFVTGLDSGSLLHITGEAAQTDGNRIVRNGLSGEIRVLFLSRFDKIIFTYHGEGQIYMNDIPLVSGIFYAWQRSSVIKSPLFLPVYYSDLLAVYNRHENKNSWCLTGRGLEFRFADSPNGLHNFSFSLNSGQLVAIMGGSGVGKSTLLGILNGNIHPQEGTITVNDQPIDTPEVRRLIGFVPQDDLLLEELTVYQNLWFTARLCFAHLSDKEIEESVNALLADLELLEIKNLQVGSSVCKTISGGQRKRLNIALELIREPSILYLDEPTSGLSSSDSEKVVMLLKEQTHKGKLVIVNIHQPSSGIYKLFDRLWLLDMGGYPVYDGNPIDAITYFKQAAKYTDSYISVCGGCGNVNPELMLTIIDAKKIDDSGNLTSIRKFTPEEWHQKYLSLRQPLPASNGLPLPDNQQRKPGWFSQFLIFSERNIYAKLTNRPYWVIALLEAPLLALIIAWLTRFADEGGYTLYANKNFISYIFMSVIVVTFIGMSISAEEIIKDKAVLKRERFLRLSRGAYLTSKIVYLFGLSGLQTILFLLVGNSILGVGHEMFFAWWSILWLTAFVANMTGLFLSKVLNSVVAIYIMIPLLLIPQILLCGLVIRFDDLNTEASRRNLVPFIGEVIPSRWAFEALMVEQFCNNPYNKPLFLIEREKYLAQYYKNVHLPEIHSLLERSKTDSSLLRTVRNELPVLAHAAHIDLPDHTLTMPAYLDKVDTALHKRADNFTAYLEQTCEEIIDKNGAEWFVGQEKTFHNEAIENLLLGMGSKHYLKEYEHRLIPLVGTIYMRPESVWGKAPFYSAEKKMAGTYFSTYTFNLLVLCFFALLAIFAIFATVPRALSKDRNTY